MHKKPILSALLLGTSYLFSAEPPTPPTQQYDLPPYAAMMQSLDDKIEERLAAARQRPREALKRRHSVADLQRIDPKENIKIKKIGDSTAALKSLQRDLTDNFTKYTGLYQHHKMASQLPTIQENKITKQNSASEELLTALSKFENLIFSTVSTGDYKSNVSGVLTSYFISALRKDEIEYDIDLIEKLLEVNKVMQLELATAGIDPRKEFDPEKQGCLEDSE